MSKMCLKCSCLTDKVAKTKDLRGRERIVPICALCQKQFKDKYEEVK